MTAFGTDQYVQEAIDSYTGKDYTTNVKNQALRNGVTHIAYCGEINDNVDIKQVEKDLIQLFGNPRGNARDRRKNPLPSHEITRISKNIYKQFVRLAKNTPPY